MTEGLVQEIRKLSEVSTQLEGSIATTKLVEILKESRDALSRIDRFSRVADLKVLFTNLVAALDDGTEHHICIERQCVVVEHGTDRYLLRWGRIECSVVMVFRASVYSESDLKLLIESRRVVEEEILNGYYPVHIQFEEGV